VNEFVEATFDKLGQDETIKYARVKNASLNRPPQLPT